MRQLVGRAPFTDLFGKKGRRWLAELELQRSSASRSTRRFARSSSSTRDRRGRAADRRRSPRMARGPAADAVPGVNVICAATFMAAIGDVGRLSRAKARRLPRARPEGAPVGLGPGDPRADLKAGLGSRPPCAGRGELVDGPPARSDPRLLSADQSAPRPPGRDRRRGPKARLPVLVPADASGGLRLRPALADPQEAAPARDPRRRSEPQGIRTGKWVAGAAMREAERATAEQAEAAYRRTVSDWQATQAKERAPARHRGAL